MDTMDEILREAATARTAVRHLWQEHHITYRPIVMVVFGMALDLNRSYDQVLQDWADYEDVYGSKWSASRWHSEICYWLLQAGVETDSVKDWMQERAKEVRQLADRVPA